MALGPQTTAFEAASTLKDSIRDKNVLITGVSPLSLGSEVVRVIAPYAQTIIIASRNVARAEEAIAAIKRENAQTKFVVIALDLTSLEAIRASADQINSLNIPINVQINNAAVAQEDKLTYTKDGLEQQFVGNHLGHFLFSALVYPSILASKPTASDPARIVTISSNAHNASPFRSDDPIYKNRPDEYVKIISYASSKSANILFSSQVAKRAAKDHVQSVCLHPGVIVTTNMGSSVTHEEWVRYGVLNEDGSPVNADDWKNLESGTSTHIVAAFDPTIPTGSYLEDGGVHNERLAPHVKDGIEEQKLWALSEQLTGQKWLS